MTKYMLFTSDGVVMVTNQTTGQSFQAKLGPTDLEMDCQYRIETQEDSRAVVSLDGTQIILTACKELEVVTNEQWLKEFRAGSSGKPVQRNPLQKALGRFLRMISPEPKMQEPTGNAVAGVRG